MKYNLQLTVIALTIACSAAAQQYNFRTYSMEEGMAQSQILSMIEDSRGNIWFGTYGGGVCIYNGTGFDYLTSRNGIVNNNVWALFEDSKGHIWIGTSGGVTVFDGIDFTTYAEKDGLAGSSVYAFEEDSEGNMFIGTEDGGISIFDGQTFTSLNTENGLTDNRIESIFCDQQDRVWISAFGKGLCIYNKGEITKLTEADGLGNNVVNDIFQDRDGSLWFCTEEGITIMSGEEFHYITVKDGLPHANVKSVFRDNRGNYWISTFGGGVVRYNGSTFQTFSENQGLSYNKVYVGLQDRTGSIWFGTDGGGACKYSGDAFIHYTKAEGLGNSVVMGIVADRKGNIWLATDGGGITRLDSTGTYNYGASSGLATNRINILFEDSKGQIWAGTDGKGIARFTGTGFISYYRGQTSSSKEVQAIIEDSNGNLWIGGDGGIDRFDGTTFYHYGEDKGGTDEKVWTISEDGNGHLWFGTDYGVIIYDGEQFKWLTEEDGLASDATVSFVSDFNGNMWIGTEGGLSYYDGKTFTNYGFEDGLSSEFIYLLVFDDDGNLLVGTEKGLDKITFTHGKEIHHVRHYGSLEGFIGIECNANAVYKARDGSIWFGTVKGATKYNPRLDKQNAVEPNIIIKGINLFYENTDWSKLTDSLMPWSRLPYVLELPYDQNHLTFEFAGISLKNPEKVKYQFMLEGFDEDWSPVTTMTRVTYSNLPAGEFTFKVKATNGEGIWNKAPATYAFSISLPFWRAWWFISLCALLVVGVFFSYTRIRTVTLRRTKRELEIKVKERTQEIYEQKKELENLSIVASETDQGVLIADKNGNIEWMNHGLEKMTEYNHEEFRKVFGTNIREISSNPEIDEILETIQSKCDSMYYDSIHVTKSGRKVWTSSTMTPIFTETGELKKVVTIYSDITDKRKTQEEIVEKNRNITDSIKYAQHIQEAILPKQEILFNAIPDSFILHKPRDIVSGDFYWFMHKADMLVICAADCTGHGVPGAFMSMIGNEFLHQVVKEKDITGPHQALSQLDSRIKRALHQTGKDEEAKDGMDIAMCAINLNQKKLQYSGAHRPALLVRDGELTELPPSRISIGGYNKKQKEFQEHVMTLQEGDALYLFTDGYTDQFGGDKGKKFLMKRFKEMVLELKDVPMAGQREILWQRFIDWKGDHNQVDDVLVMGLRI